MMSDQKPFLSVVIPAYNEVGRISTSLSRVLDYLPSVGDRFEVIVVDDGSADDTAGLAQAAGSPVRVIRLKRNRGKGAAVRTGVLESHGSVLLFMDADLSTGVEEWAAFKKKLTEGYHIVIGSRAHSASRIRVHQPWHRERMGKIFNWFLRHLLPMSFRDTQCGFKAFDMQVAKHLFGISRIDGFAFDAEILYLADRLEYRVAELPVTWVDSVPSRVQPIRHGLEMLRDLLRIRSSVALGRYELSNHGNPASEERREEPNRA